ncbi:hypothetical protein BDV59DRAFT_189188 [Aspergillus ambiguus]|uniref:Zn(II)2Cys6 transcription factor domain-containing protein n=1 Tax=Aspergillus ambiguus TaxID=176160 RepID=UPI003CCD5D0A
MFGTLVSTSMERGSLEFIEDPHPPAAFSRNLRANIHISCLLCRSRKVRCSRGQKGCQRCVAMGLKCVYPESRERIKQGHNKSDRPVTAETENVLTQMVCDDEPFMRKNQIEYGDKLAVDDLHDITFDDSFMDKDLFTTWVMENPLQHNLDGSSSKDRPPSSSDIITDNISFSKRGRSTTMSLPRPDPDLSTVDTSLPSIYSPSATDSAGELEPWDGPHAAHGDITWTMNSDGSGPGDTTSDLLSLGHGTETSNDFDFCRCLRHSISFLERLISRSAVRENRIDILLTGVRNSIETLAILMACERCTAGLEQNALLAMAIRQISVICGKAADCYKNLYLCGISDKNSFQQETELGVSVNRVDISVLTYRANCRERLHILKSLVGFQIAEIQQHINTFKSRCRNRPSPSQAEALMEAEKHIRLAKVAISSSS